MEKYVSKTCDTCKLRKSTRKKIHKILCIERTVSLSELHSTATNEFNEISYTFFPILN